MSRDLFTRAKVIGLTIVVAAFGLGLASGYVIARRPLPGLTVTVTTTDEIPKELQALHLTGLQVQQVREALRAGRPRVMAVLQDMEPRMRAALDATEAAIEKVLTPEQVTQWKEYRRMNPPRTEQRLINR